MPFANFMIANGAGALAWALFYGLGAYYLGKGVEEFARPFAMALAVVGAIVVVSMIVLLAAQGTGACGCGRAGHSRAVAGGTAEEADRSSCRTRRCCRGLRRSCAPRS